MTDYLIERVKLARNSLQTSLRNDLISAGEEVVRPLIKLLPTLTSYVITSDIIEVLGAIGGNDSYKTLITLLEDSQPGNLPKRLISQSCIKALGLIGDERSIAAIIKTLTFCDPELRYTAVDVLHRMAVIRHEFKNKVIEALVLALQNETFEKPGKYMEDSLAKLGYQVMPREVWPNKPSKPMIIEPQIPVFNSNPVVNQVIPSFDQSVTSNQINQEINNATTPASIVCTNNEYSCLSDEQQKEILNRLLTSPEENEKLEIINKLGKSGNSQVIDELLTTIKSTESRKIQLAATDAIINISPNDLKLRFLVLEYILDKRVIGQSEAKMALANALRVAQIGLKRSPTSNKPIGSFLFVGPTGVGKTELAKALAEALYGSELKLIRLDMSEYTDLSDKNKLIGSPPGFVGSQEGGMLTRAVIKNPKSVVLFDEIEKAHPEIFNLFLQVLDDGRLTDSKGITVGFRDTIIIMTSNVGSDYIMESIKLKMDTEEVKEVIQDVLKTKFKPEFLNRLSDYIIFKPLTSDELLEVLDLKLKPTANNLFEKYQLHLEVSVAAKNAIIEATQKQEFGFSPRELARIIDNEIVQPLSEELLDMEISESYKEQGVIPRGGMVIIDICDSKLCININKAEVEGVR